MHSQRLHIRLLVLAATAALIALALVPAAAAKPTSDETFIPGVTDSGTGVLRDLQRKDIGGEAFIPGVTDSTTGVARDLERRGLEPRALPTVATLDDSGFEWDDRAIGIGAMLAAAMLMAAYAAFATPKKAQR